MLNGDLDRIDNELNHDINELNHVITLFCLANFLLNSLTNKKKIFNLYFKFYLVYFVIIIGKNNNILLLLVLIFLNK